MPKPKWITPSALQALLKAQGEAVPLTTISTWIIRGNIPSKLIREGPNPRYLVDASKIPERRAAGRPYSLHGLTGVEVLRGVVAFCDARPEELNAGKSPVKLIGEFAKTVKKKK